MPVCMLDMVNGQSPAVLELQSPSPRDTSTDVNCACARRWKNFSKSSRRPMSSRTKNLHAVPRCFSTPALQQNARTLLATDGATRTCCVKELTWIGSLMA